MFFAVINLYLIHVLLNNSNIFGRCFYNILNFPAKFLSKFRSINMSLFIIWSTCISS